MARYLIGHVKGDKGDKGDSWIYLECSTARNVADKVVTSSGFVLTPGARITVRFTDTGSSNPSSGNLTLNVNNTGAKAIVDGHSNKTVMNYLRANLFYNDMVADFVYDGNYWVYLNKNNDAEIADIVNVYGAKNFANYNKSVTRRTSGSIGDTLFALDLEVGDKITFVCTQDNAMTSNTRNTLQVVNKANNSINFRESNDENFHLASGLHILQFTVATAGTYNFSIWTHTLGTETTYSKFMVCDTDIYNVNPDYVPYAKTNRQLTLDSVDWDDYRELGAVNLLPNNLTSQVTTEVTWTVNNDGTVTANNTTATVAQRAVDVFNNSTNPLVFNVPVKLSGVPNESTNENYSISALANGTWFVGYDDGVIIPANANITRVCLVIKTGQIVTNLTFKPMITPVSYNGPYVPYAKSNKELTKNVKELSTNATKLVQISTPVSIFDVLANRSLYPSSNIYWSTSAKITNGSDTFSSLLSINDNAIVRIDVYSEWYIGIEINDAFHGNALIAWANKITTQLKFIQINTSTSPYVSQVTVSKAT